MYGYGYINSLGLIDGGVSVDPDAQAFITAASITDPTQQSAVNQLVIDLKAASIWTKMKAVYPFVGGSASSHKWNLKDPQDTNAAFRIQFNGGVTHTSNGVLFGGVNGYANTFVNNSTNNVTSTNYGWGFYSRTDNTVNAFDAYNGASTHIYGRFGDNNTYHRGINASPDNYNDGNSLGLFHQYGKAASSTAFHNGTKKLTGGAGVVNVQDIWFGGGVGAYSNRNHAFAFVSESLSDTEAANLYTAVQTFQTTLSRNV